MPHKNVIELHFDEPNCLALGGRDSGHALYEEQLKNQLTKTMFDQGVLIKFPDSVVIIGSNFMKALMAPIIKSFGLYKTRQNVSFQTSSDELTKEVERDII